MNEFIDEIEFPDHSPEWAGYMTDEQFEVEDKILEDLLNSESFEFHMVLGVAGTGKTQVLLSLMEDLRDKGVPVVFDCPDGLNRYLSRCGIQVTSDPVQKGAVHIVDDPKTLRVLKSKFIRAQENGARAFVVGMDPMQFSDRKTLLKTAHYLDPNLATDEYLSSFAKIQKTRHNDVIYLSIPKVHWLKTVFRQNANVGRQALEMTARLLKLNHPYILQEKKAEWSKILDLHESGLFRDISFRADGGFFEVSAVSNPAEQILDKVLNMAKDPSKWTWTSPFLLVCPPSIANQIVNYDPSSMPFEPKSRLLNFTEILTARIKGLPIPERQVEVEKEFPSGLTLGQLVSRFNGEIKNYNQAIDVRGCEFQEVFIFLDKKQFSYLQQFREGLGQDEWQQVSPLHTFMTRAKRRVAIFTEA
jgi:hypothetical protein